MEQVGIVVKLDGNKAQVSVKRISGCGGGCKSWGGCDTPSTLVSLENKIGAKQGDYVEIKSESRNLLKYMFLIYGIPFATLLIGTIGGMGVLKGLNVKNYELMGMLIGLVFLAIGYGLVRILDNKFKDKGEDQIMSITRII